MPSKLVYVSDQHHCTGDAFDILAPKQLDKLLEEGFDVIKRDTRKVTHPTSKKQVTVDYLELAKKALERGVSAAPVRNERAAALLNEDGHLPSRHVSSRPDNGSYLGSGGDFSDIIEATGPSVGRSISGDVAFGMGVDAAKTGALASACSFRPGTLPYREWMKGFAAGGGNMPVASPPEAMAEAYQYGKTAAKGDKDLEVTCPYANGSDLYDEWVRGFSENGGKIE